MAAIITDYAIRRIINNPEFYDISAHDHMRFMTPFGDGFQILEAAGMLSREYDEHIMNDDNTYRISTTIRFTPDPRAIVAFKNLSNDEPFIGGFQDFVSRLVDYAKLWREAIAQLNIYPFDPWFSGGMRESVYSWSGQYVKPALEDIIRWSSDDMNFETLHVYAREAGIDSMIEAMREGVPLEDILA